MRNITDKNKRIWVLEITVSRAKRIRDLTGFDILKLAIPAEIEKFSGDSYLILDAIYIATGADADESITPDEFLDCFDGPGIDHATIELVREVADFFGDERAKSLHRLLDVALQARTNAMEATNKSICAIEAKISVNKSGGTSTEQPESAESIQAH